MNSDPFSDACVNQPPREPEDSSQRESPKPPAVSPFASTTDGMYRPPSGETPADARPGSGIAIDEVLYDGLATSPPLITETPEATLDKGRAPSLPIVLISSACGVAGGVLGLYISYGLLDFGIALSAGFATFGLLFGLGVSGAALTAATGERGAIINMAFSCTLITLMVLFMTMCAVAGATIATLLVRA